MNKNRPNSPSPAAVADWLDRAPVALRAILRRIADANCSAPTNEKIEACLALALPSAEICFTQQPASFPTNQSGPPPPPLHAPAEGAALARKVLDRHPHDRTFPVSVFGLEGGRLSGRAGRMRLPGQEADLRNGSPGGCSGAAGGPQGNLVPAEAEARLAGFGGRVSKS